MTSPSYSQNKVHIYKWRKNNIQAYNAIARKNQTKYNIWAKIKKEFLNILLD
jgi:hypothetical protein